VEGDSGGRGIEETARWTTEGEREREEEGEGGVEGER
jgi:hypothetical protein